MNEKKLKQLKTAAQMYVDLAMTNRRLAMSNPSSESFYQKEAATNYVFLDRLLQSFDEVPEELAGFQKDVDLAQKIYGEAFHIVARQVQREVENMVASPAPTGKGTRFRDRIINFYSLDYDDEGDEVTSLEKSLAIPGDSSLFSELPKQKFNKFECVIDYQELRLDADRTLKANKFSLDIDRELYNDHKELLEEAAETSKNRFLLQELYMKSGGSL